MVVVKDIIVIKYMNNEYKVEGANIGIGLQGFYKVQIVNSTTKEITVDYDWHKNLILNSGMDIIAGSQLGNLNGIGICGTGSRPNSISGGTSTITQSGMTASLYDQSGLPDFTSSYSTYTSSVNVGDVILYTNNSQSNVVSIIDGYNIGVDQSYTISVGDAQTFTIWKTSQRDLEGESKRTATLLTGTGNCGTTIVSNVVIYRRTFDFSVETVSQNYTEVGVSWTLTKATGSTFSRILLPAPITIGIGFQLRLIHDLHIIFTPDSPQYFTASISGWPVSPATNTIATQSLQNINVSTVDTSGGTGGDGYSSEPCAVHGYDGNLIVSGLSVTSASLSSVGTAVTRDSTLGATLNGTISPYVLGSYTLYKTCNFDLNTGNSANIRSLIFGTVGFLSGNSMWNGKYQSLAVVFDQPQTKLNTQIMSVVWKWSWSRVLQ